MDLVKIIEDDITPDGIIRNNYSIRYLLPMLKKYPSKEKLTFNILDKSDNFGTVAYLHIGNELFSKCKPQYRNERLLFITFDINGPRNNGKPIDKYGESRFHAFLQNIRKSKYYIDDFWVVFKTFTYAKHQVVLKIPNGMEDTYDYFLKGEYSKMYSSDFLQSEFPSKLTGTSNDLQYYAKVVIAREFEAEEYYEDRIREEYNMKYFSMSDLGGLKPAEFDIPLKVTHEILFLHGSKSD